MMRVFAMYPPGATETPADWAEAREVEGWDGVAVSDHVWTNGVTSPHLWVTLGAMSTATSRIMLTSSFANGLLRSPVDVAHAALMLQISSRGRFEAGLGAGWDASEAAALGLDFPDARTRRHRYAEALHVVRSLLNDGCCHYRGKHLTVDVESLELPDATAPPLVAAAGGTRTIEAVAPHVDCIEVKFPGFAGPGGAINFDRLRRVTPEDIEALVDNVQNAAPDAAVGLTLVLAAGEGRAVDRMIERLSGTWYGGFVGAADDVARQIKSLSAMRIDRLQIGASSPSTYQALGPHLFENQAVPATSPLPPTSPVGSGELA